MLAEIKPREMQEFRFYDRGVCWEVLKRIEPLGDFLLAGYMPKLKTREASKTLYQRAKNKFTIGNKINVKPD